MINCFQMKTMILKMVEVKTINLIMLGLLFCSPGFAYDVDIYQATEKSKSVIVVTDDDGYQCKLIIKNDRLWDHERIGQWAERCLNEYLSSKNKDIFSTSDKIPKNGER